jgi:transcriptional regulator with XRE-family HTH domain
MNQIQRFREGKHMKQKQLAVLVGCSLDSIGRYERDERDIPSSVLMKIADALGCSTDELLSNPPLAPTAGATRKEPTVKRDRHKKKTAA